MPIRLNSGPRARPLPLVRREDGAAVNRHREAFRRPEIERDSEVERELLVHEQWLPKPLTFDRTCHPRHPE